LSNCRFRDRVASYVRESGVEWVGAGAISEHAGRALGGAPRHPLLQLQLLPGPSRGVQAPLAFPIVNRFSMAVLYGRAGRLTAKTGVFRPRRADEWMARNLGLTGTLRWGIRFTALETLIQVGQRRQAGPKVGPTSAFCTAIAGFQQERKGRLATFGPTLQLSRARASSPRDGAWPRARGWWPARCRSTSGRP
jgi:hypothetical protein